MKTPEEKKLLKAQKDYSAILKRQMTDEEKIQMLNTPYRLLPEQLKPGMVKSPQMFNFVRMTQPNIGRQNERFGARLIKYRRNYNVNEERFCEICNEYAMRFDLPAMENRRAQKTRITRRDLENYELNNVCPKIDKMMIIAGATGMPLDYFAGYGPDSRRKKIVPFKQKGGVA